MTRLKYEIRRMEAKQRVLEFDDYLIKYFCTCQNKERVVFNIIYSCQETPNSVFCATFYNFIKLNYDELDLSCYLTTKFIIK